MNIWLNNKQVRLNIFPCLLCGTADSNHLGICGACEQALPHNFSACRRCALPIPDTGHAQLCGQCLASPPTCYQAQVPYIYAAPLDALITGLKFRQQLYSAQLLGGLLAQHLRANLHTYPECIVPVPLHPHRLRERGYNQALELALPLARSLEIGLEKNLVQRVRQTRPQSELKLAYRGTNLRQAFQLKRSPNYRHIALVDDVITSGHTVNALAQEFHRQGVEKIEVWAIARAVCRN
ncbi:Competence protein F homolog, phosphoribosyltransferase domain; protein YhgH required for utilization of DNA as sole source of carbon and energy [hydrothermal vent metagenome]|uniref:Competence protein F homolog, phosphoribosyltransferase domain protein YhgH required for utilization of DNA as sole source of carbon and energy n=1 Tax=hydrothermal vent metagenome TaxID=652676 RepID=A0A3B1B7L1_9ZZZZ